MSKGADNSRRSKYLDSNYKEKHDKSKRPLNEDLMELDKDCREMLLYPQELTPYLKNEELIKAGDSEEITQQAAILARDTKSMINELDEMKTKIPTAEEVESDDLDVMGLFGLGQKYGEWQERYMQLITPTIDRLSELLQDASGKLKEQRDKVESETNSEEVQ